MKKLLIIALLIAGVGDTQGAANQGKLWLNTTSLDELPLMHLPQSTRQNVMALYRLYHEIQTTKSPLRGLGGMGIAFKELGPAIEEYKKCNSLPLDEFDRKYGKTIIPSRDGSAPLSLWIDLAKQGKIPEFATHMPLPYDAQ